MSCKIVNKVLIETRILGKLRKIIMESISTTKMTILWKGQKEYYFDTKVTKARWPYFSLCICSLQG